MIRTYEDAVRICKELERTYKVSDRDLKCFRPPQGHNIVTPERGALFRISDDYSVELSFGTGISNTYYLLGATLIMPDGKIDTERSTCSANAAEIRELLDDIK